MSIREVRVWGLSLIEGVCKRGYKGTVCKGRSVRDGWADYFYPKLHIIFMVRSTKDFQNRFLFSWRVTEAQFCASSTSTRKSQASHQTSVTCFYWEILMIFEKKFVKWELYVANPNRMSECAFGKRRFHASNQERTLFDLQIHHACQWSAIALISF